VRVAPMGSRTQRDAIPRFYWGNEANTVPYSSPGSSSPNKLGVTNWEVLLLRSFSICPREQGVSPFLGDPEQERRQRP
jgi:hypothetical protein